MSRSRLRSGPGLLVVRYRVWLVLGLLAGPMVLALVHVGSSPRADLTTTVGLPLYGDGRVATWVVLCLYSGVVAAPLLSWDHADIEVSAPAFERRSCYVPHGLAHLMGLTTLAAVASAPAASAAVFWASSSMAVGTLWAILLQRVAWIGTLGSALLALGLILQGRLDVWRTSGEASAAAVSWVVLGVVAALRRRRLLTRPR